jgi:transposase
MVQAPSAERKDAKRTHRERERLITQRVQHVNRAKGLLATQRIHDHQPLRRDRRALLAEAQAPGMERLRDMVALSAADVVHVRAPNRLGRSYAHQVLLLEKSARADARVVFLNRPVGDSPEDNGSRHPEPACPE